MEARELGISFNWEHTYCVCVSLGHQYSYEVTGSLVRKELLGDDANLELIHEAQLSSNIYRHIGSKQERKGEWFPAALKGF